MSTYEIILVGLCLAFSMLWITKVINCLKLHRLNESMIAMFYNEKSILYQLAGVHVVTDIQNRMSSISRLILRFTIPSIYWDMAVDWARSIASQFEHATHGLSSEEKEKLNNLQLRLMKLLAKKVKSQGMCKHRYYNTEGAIKVAVYRSEGTRVTRLLWCKYCLRSWYEEEQYPVIVHPPR